MKLNELEALVKEQGNTIAALVKEQGALIEAITQINKEADEHRTSMLESVKSLGDLMTTTMNLMGYSNEDPEGPFFGELTALKAHVEELDVLVKGRNKSAAVKRNMTDADALSVLTGEYKDDAHKVAAEKIGLTYAQVYSCRMEYTFKHVLHELRKAEWKNPWKK